MRKKKLQIIILLTIFCCVVGGIQYSQRVSSKAIVPQNFNYLPNGTFLRGASLSYDQVLADILWIKALIYFGDQFTTQQDFKWLFQILNTVTILDPLYQDPYEFGGVILASELGDIEKSSELLLKGLEKVPKSHPRYWYLPFFLAYNYWYYNSDFKTGAYYLEQASKFPQAPSYLPMLTARMYADSSNAGMALPFLDEMMHTAKTPERKQQLLQRKNEVLVNFHLDELDKAVVMFKSKFNKYPDSLEDLVINGFLREIPLEPFGGEYYYDFITKKVFSTKSERIKVHGSKKNN